VFSNQPSRKSATVCRSGGGVRCSENAARAAVSLAAATARVLAYRYSFLPVGAAAWATHLPTAAGRRFPLGFPVGPPFAGDRQRAPRAARNRCQPVPEPAWSTNIRPL